MSAGGTIAVRINGEDRSVAPGQSVTDLLVSLGLRPELVVVERNREILERARYGEVRVEAGDQLELVHFVGGG